MPKKPIQPMIIEQEVSVALQPVVSVENNTMINDMTNTSNKLNINASVWENRRVWVKPETKPVLNLTKAQILAATPVPFLEELLNENRIALTSDANGSRKDYGHVIFDNNVQIKQMFKALALYQFGIHGAWMASKSEQKREIYLLDTLGDFSRWVVETSDGKHVTYEVYYASIKYNNLGNQVIEKGKLNPMAESIHREVEGFTDSDGRVYLGYNGWAKARNAAVLKSVTGVELNAEEIEFLKGTTPNADPNKFVQYNTVHLINEQDIVNKYILESWLLLDETRPAFEIWTNAGSFEKAIARLERKLEVGIRAYRNELAALSNVNIWDEAVTE